MAQVPPSASPEDADIWRSIEREVASVAAAARSGMAPSQFYQRWLERTVHALGAAGGVVWELLPNQQVSYVAESQLPPWLRSGSTWQSIGKLAQSGATRIVSPQTEPAIFATLDTANLGKLVIGSLLRDSAPPLVAVILFDAEVAEAVLQNACKVLDIFRDVAQDFHRLNELAALKQQLADGRALDDLLARIHGHLRAIEVAYTIANDARVWLGCDRVTVLEVRHRQARLLAVSGVDQPDRRAEEIVRLERLATTVAAITEPILWTTGAPTDLPPQVDDALQEYLDRSPARTLGLLPLKYRFGGPSGRDVASDVAASGEPEETLAVLVVESFQYDADPRGLWERAQRLARHAATALGSAWEHERIPLRVLQMRIGHLARLARRRAVAVALSVAVLVAAVAALGMVQADFAVEARGTLEPQSQRNLFAPSEGVIERILVEHGAGVKAGQELLELRNDRLNLDLSRVSGEMQTLQTKLSTVRVKRSSNAARDDDKLLAAEEEQIRGQIEGLQNQQRILAALRAEMRMVSPMDGVVLTWNTSDLLQDRPVRQGQLLLSLADTSGPWQLNLRVPDRDTGHLLSARDQGGKPLTVSYLLVSRPEQRYAGQVRQIALDSTALPGETPSAHVTVDVDATNLSSPRAGTGVLAHIQCGRRPIGYVWFHELIDAIRTGVLF